MRPLKALINLEHARSNYKRVRSLCPRSKIIATLKANAYGHGLDFMANAFSDADAFSVLCIEEAIELREIGFDGRILLLEGVYEFEELKIASAFNFDIVVHNDYQLSLIRQLPDLKKINIHLKINTGMNRLGFDIENLPKVLKQIADSKKINQIILMTHFANADNEKGIKKELNTIKNLIQNYKYDYSAANSAAIINYPETHLEWVRPGIMLYGASPFQNKTANELGLKPVMNLVSEIIAIRLIKKGDSVGYGSSFIADKDMQIGVVACGYADGFPRIAPTGTPIIVENQLTRTLGRVSMDMLCVDLSNVSNVSIGSKVELWGDNLSVDEVARHAQTVGYELLCAVSSSIRVPLSISYG